MFKFLKEKLQNWTKSFSNKELEKDKKELVKEKKSKKTKVAEAKKSKAKAKEHKKEEKYEEVNEILEQTKDEQASEESNLSPKSLFSRIKSKLSKIKISEEDFETYSEELNMLLLENNVAFEVAEKIISDLKEKVLNKEISRNMVESEIRNSLKESIEDILVEPFNVLEKIKQKTESPYVMLFVGINGTGKTTTIAKVADFLKRNNISCVIAAGDTFRAASIEQIKTHGQALGIKVISQQYGADPAAVGFDAISYAKKSGIKCVLIDTAGRMHTAKNLLKEIEKISRVCNPDLKLFIGESITGNDVVEQAKSFNESIGLDGIILTKADIDEKGGTALSVGFVTKKPVLFLGMGQGYKDLEVFNKKKFIEKLGL